MKTNVSYIEEYWEEAIIEYGDPFLEPSYLYEEEEQIKTPVYKENYYLRENLQNRFVKDVISKPVNQEKIIEFTGKFLDEHAFQLSTSGPIHMFTFGEKETKFLYELFGVTPELILELFNNMIEEAFFGKLSKFIRAWVEKAPHKLLITCMLIDALQNDYEDIITCCEYIWAFCEYPILFRKQWPTGVKEDVMNYTIEHLGTKFKIKKVKNLQGLLKYDANSSVASMKERLKTGADNTYTDFMHRMRNQMGNTFKNIARVYYANDEENASQHSKSSQFDDGSIADQEGHTTNIAQTVDKTISKMQTSGVNPALVKVCADASKVDSGNLSSYINQINSTKNNRMDKFIENVITSYLNRNPTDTSVSSNEFLNYGLALYRSIGTSKDSLYQEIKSILNFWIYDIINIKQFYQREATWINYTRAVFNYMIMMIKIAN